MADLRLVLLPVRSHAVMQSYALMRRIFAQTRITAWIWTDQNGSKGQAADLESTRGWFRHPSSAAPDV